MNNSAASMDGSVSPNISMFVDSRKNSPRNSVANINLNFLPATKPISKVTLNSKYRRDRNQNYSLNNTSIMSPITSRGNNHELFSGNKLYL